LRLWMTSPPFKFFRSNSLSFDAFDGFAPIRFLPFSVSFFGPFPDRRSLEI
jgi:hypothetical protein